MTQRYKGSGSSRSSDGTRPLRTQIPTQYHPQPTTLRELLGHGEDLARVMDSQVINLAWSWTIQAINEEWIESVDGEKAKREDLHRMIQLSKMFKKTMEHYLEMAKLQHQQMLQQEQLNRQAAEAGVPVEEL